MLTLFRISNDNFANSPSGQEKPPMLFMHGIGDSADCFIVHKPDKAPAFVAASEGYDVWLGNLRGNKYSRKHKSLDPDTDMDFWKFSWSENGRYDLPALLNFIKQETGYEKVAYVGHSMGTTSMFYAMVTNYEQIARDVSIFVALAPVTTISESPSAAIKLALPFLEPIRFVMETFDMYELLQATAI